MLVSVLLLTGAISGSECLILEQDVHDQQPIHSSMTSSIDCREGVARPPLNVDRHTGRVYANVDLPAGTYLGRLLLDDEPLVAAGDSLVMQVSIGQVRVFRDVEAVQSGSFAEQIFVRDNAGNVFPLFVRDAEAANP